jgi:hypothetical protein
LSHRLSYQFLELAFQESRKGGSSLGRKIDHEEKQRRRLNRHGLLILMRKRNTASPHRTTTTYISPATSIVQSIRQNSPASEEIIMNVSSQKKSGIRNIFNCITMFLSEFLAKT